MPGGWHRVCCCGGGDCDVCPGGTSPSTIAISVSGLTPNQFGESTQWAQLRATANGTNVLAICGNPCIFASILGSASWPSGETDYLIGYYTLATRRFYYVINRKTSGQPVPDPCTVSLTTTPFTNFVVFSRATDNAVCGGQCGCIGFNYSQTGINFASTPSTWGMSGGTFSVTGI